MSSFTFDQVLVKDQLSIMDKCPVEHGFRKYDDGKLFETKVHFFHGPTLFVRTRFIVSFGPDLAPPRRTTTPTSRRLPWTNSSLRKIHVI